jgi:hypothetical protein
MITKENAESFYLQFQRRTSRIVTVSTWPKGNFQVSYGSSGIHSVFGFASPERLWLLYHKQQTADVSRNKTIQGFKSGEGAGRSVVPLRAIDCFRKRLFKNSRTARRKCVDHHHVWTIDEPQSADPHFAAATEGRYIGNRCKQPQSDVVGESGVTEVCQNGSSRWTLWTSYLIVRRTVRGNCASVGLS